MKKYNFFWMFFIIRRFNAADTKGRSAITRLFSILGIAFGVSALIVVLSVMNGLQMGYIDAILQVSSAHVRLSGSSSELEEARKKASYDSFYIFSEAQTLVQGNYARQQGVMLRAIPSDILSIDSGFKNAVKVSNGSFDIESPNSVILGQELARSLSVSVGDIISVLAVSGSSSTDMFPENSELCVTGVFDTGYYEIDSSFAFISLENARSLFGEEDIYKAAIKLKNPEHDGQYIAALHEELPNLEAESWRSFNHAFFGALRVEKNMLLLLVVLIFLVVTVNIYNGMRRSIYERREDISVLASLGAEPQYIQLLFIINGLTIGVIGAFIGLIFGLFLSIQINTIFFVFETVVNGLFSFMSILFSNFYAETFFMFGPQFFYMDAVPVRIVFSEVLYIFLFGIFSASIASWIAAKRILKLKPAEVLRYE